MKTFGIKHADGSVELVSLLEDQPLMIEPYDVRQLCPRDRYWTEHPHAPWNAWWSASKADWVAQYPVWAKTAENDPAAPWNQPEPSRDPADYPDQHWTPPTKLSLVKLPEPVGTVATTHEPFIALADDGQSVERRWREVPRPLAERREMSRAALRTQWAGLPAWIRGPFAAQFATASALLDAGDDDAAEALIRFADAPSGYSAEQLAEFASTKTSLADAIASLP